MSALERIRQHPARYLIPNAMTVARPIIGAMGLRDARNGNWRKATKEFAIAESTDTDGKAARFFDATSKVGAFIDPIADFLLRLEMFAALAPVMNKAMLSVIVGAELDNLRLNAKIQKGRDPIVPEGARWGTAIQSVGVLGVTEGMHQDNDVLRFVGQIVMAGGSLLRDSSYRKLRRELL